jgi:quercetin dioxygenase-like cupin family protein
MLIDFKNMPKVKIWEGITGSVYHSDSITVGHLDLVEGIHLPTHHHVHEQWSNVIEGTLEFTIGDQTHILTAGMSVHIPSNVPHSGKAHTACKVIDIFCPVREDWKGLGEV